MLARQQGACTLVHVYSSLYAYVMYTWTLFTNTANSGLHTAGIRRYLHIARICVYIFIYIQTHACMLTNVSLTYAMYITSYIHAFLSTLM